MFFIPAPSAEKFSPVDIAIDDSRISLNMAVIVNQKFVRLCILALASQKLGYREPAAPWTEVVRGAYDDDRCKKSSVCLYIGGQQHKLPASATLGGCLLSMTEIGGGLARAALTSFPAAERLEVGSRERKRERERERFP